MRLGRGALIVAGAVAAATTMSGCSVMYNGALAVTKGADSAVTNLVQTCDRALDELTLYGNPN